MPTSPPTPASRAASNLALDVKSDTPAPATRSLWVWWHLLSLDAPTVAVFWCWFFASVCGLTLPWVALSTLALGTWCVYVADRLLDGWRSTDTVTLRDRHWFYLRHRKPFVVAWIIAAVPLAYLIFFRVSRVVRTDDIVLCLIGIAYFLLIHGRFSENSATRRLPGWLPKELMVGFLFAIATAVPTWSRLTGDRGLLAAAIFTFGAACWLNCVAIQTWEDAEASQEVMHAILSSNGNEKEILRPHCMTEFLGRHLSAFAAAVGGLAICLAYATATSTIWPLFAAVALSAILFLGLIRHSRRFSALSLRIAADAALLTPLLFTLRVR